MELFYSIEFNQLLKLYRFFILTCFQQKDSTHKVQSQFYSIFIMPNEFLDHNNQIKQIKPPEQDYSEIKHSSLNQKIQEETSSTILQNRSKKHRSKKLREIQTNFIKIKPINNQHQHESESESNQTYVNQCKNSIQSLINSEPQQTYLHQEEKTDQRVYKMDSPILYKFSDDEDIQSKQQTCPQSSRRPLNEKQTSSNQLSSDQFQSPMKLIKSSRRLRSKQQSRNHNDKRFIKMKRENKIVQQREKTEVYQYEEQINDGQNLDEQLSSENDEEGREKNEEKDQVNVDRQPAQKLQGEISKPQLVILKSSSFSTLINAEIPKGNFVNCIIKRKRSEGFFDTIVTYELYLLQDKKYLMTCVKNRMFSTTSHFEFFRERSQSHNYHKQNLYAYLDSNFTGTEFVLKTIIKNDTISERSTAIDRSQLSRINQSTSNILETQKKVASLFPNQGKVNKIYDEQQAYNEKQVCFISFKANLFGLAGQREVKLLKKKKKKLTKTQKFSAIKQAQQCGQNDKYYEFCSKKAIVGKNGLQLDMKNIAKMQSKKNILLQDSDSKQILIFGKVKQDIYSIAIGSPLSILEGLAFGIANLDRKFFVD